MAGIKHDRCSKPAMSITCDPWSTTGSVERGTLSMPRRAAYAASCCSSTSGKLLRSVKDVPDASARRYSAQSMLNLLTRRT